MFKRYTGQFSKSQRFWEINIDDKSLVIHQGIVGRKGKIIISEFNSPEEAINASKKLALKKEKGGYTITSFTSLFRYLIDLEAEDLKRIGININTEIKICLEGMNERQRQNELEDSFLLYNLLVTDICGS